MPIEPGMKVLDLGCGKAMSSIFLAREFRVSVWATDLWIPATTRELGDEIPTALEPHWVGLLLLALTGLVADPLDQDPQSRGR